jgi:hypothetical protein
VKVKELREKLSELDPELPVLLEHYEGGFSSVEIVYSRHLINNGSYYEEYEELIHRNIKPQNNAKECIIID